MGASPCDGRDWEDAHVSTPRSISMVTTLSLGSLHRPRTRQGWVERGSNRWHACARNNACGFHAKRRGLTRLPGPPVHGDLVLRDFTATGPNELWLTDITEHPTSEGSSTSVRSRTCSRTASWGTQ